MAGFFSDFLKGAAETGANILTERSKAQAEADAYRQKLVMQASVEEEAAKAKKKRDEDAAERAAELQRKLFAEQAGLQTNQAVRDSIVKRQTMSTVPGYEDPNALPTDIQDDTSKEVVLTPPSLTDQSTQATQSNPMASLKPEQIQMLAAAQASPEFTAEKGMEMMYKFQKENNAPKEDLAKKQAEDQYKIDNLVNTLGMSKEEATAKIMGVKDYVAPISDQQKQEYGVLDLPKAVESTTTKSYDKYINDEAAIANNDKIIQIAQQYTDLNDKNTTGGILGVVPVIKDVVAAYNSEFSVMESATKELVMKNIKNLGAGTAISNSDREFAEKAGLSTMKPEEANEAQAAAMIAFAKVDNEYREFASIQRSMGKSNPDAIKKAWKEYTNDNPVFTKLKVGDIKINTERLSWQDYFAAKQNGTLEEAKSSAKANYTQSEGMPGVPNAQIPSNTSDKSQKNFRNLWN